MHHFKRYKTILSSKGGMNLYRGCTHGCIYCDSRSLCYGMDHPFEDIEVKQDAPAQLLGELRSRRRRCMIATGSMSDPYMPLEQELGLTRQCAELALREGFGFTALTKSCLIERDFDLFQEIGHNTRSVVQMTLTTLDDALCRDIEPNVSPTSRRLATLEKAASLGIETAVWLSPLLPFLNDTPDNVRGLVERCAEVGVKAIVYFGAGLTLRDGNREYFYQALDRHFPGLRQRYAVRYGRSYECPSPDEAALDALVFQLAEKHGILCGTQEVFRFLARFPTESGEQLSLF